MSENQTEFTYKNQIDWESIQKNSISYLKIIGMSFIIPIWIATFTNGVALLWKIATWAQNDIMFWEVKQYLFMPLVYLVWFYYLTVKKLFKKIHKDFFRKWISEFSGYTAENLIQQYKLSKEGKGKMDLDKIMMWMNERISSLPNWLEWITKKLIDKIPFVEFINAYDSKNLENGNKEKLASDLYQKIDKRLLAIFDSFIPWWTKLIIPINILLLFLYFKL